jgi:hypothetical protein
MVTSVVFPVLLAQGDLFTGRASDPARGVVCPHAGGTDTPA